MKQFLSSIFCLAVFAYGGYNVGFAKGKEAMAKSLSPKPMTQEEKEDLYKKIFSYWEAGCRTAMEAVKKQLHSEGDVSIWCEMQSVRARKQWEAQQNE